MKKLFPLLCLFTLLFAFTCEDEPLDFDAETSTDSDPELLGEWNLVSFDASVSTTTNFQGQQISSDVDINSTTVNYTIDFTESNFNTSGSYSYIADITANGINIPAEPYTLTDVNGSGSYSVNGNEMTIDGSFFEFSFQGMDFEELQGEQTANFQITDNGQTLTFSQNETTTDTDPTGATVTSTQVSTSVWTRGSVSNTCDAQAETNAAATAYNQDNTNEDLCIAYRIALENQITECGDADGSLQNIIDELGECSGTTAGGTLKVTTGTLPIEFTQQTISIEDSLITVEGVSAGGSYEIYFQITEGDTGTNVFQNFVLTLNGTDYFPSTQGFDDFTSDTTVSSGNVLQATFFGLVESSAGADLNLTQGVVDVTY
jgi:hypothetical protein